MRQAGSAVHVTSFRDARVVVVDPQLYVRKLVQDALRAIGFSHVEGCAGVDRLVELLDVASPDLILIDIDEEHEKACQTLQSIRKNQLGRDPFVVVVALTWHPDPDTVAAALNAGADDLVAKPVSAQILKERVIRQIVSRKKFVVSANYMGPDRRLPDRAPSSEDLPGIDVPNNLRFKAIGDRMARADDTAIADAMRALHIQKLFRLTRKLAMLADAMLSAARQEADGSATLDGLDGVAAALERIEVLVAMLGLGDLAEPVTAVRAAYGAIRARGSRAERAEIDRLGRAALRLGNALAIAPETAEFLRRTQIAGKTADISEAAEETPTDSTRRCA